MRRRCHGLIHTFRERGGGERGEGGGKFFRGGVELWFKGVFCGFEFVVFLSLVETVF